MTNSAVCFLERYSLSNQVVVEDIRFIKVHNGVIYQSSQWCLKENFRGKKKMGMNNIFPSTEFMAPNQPYRAQDSSPI